MAFRSIFVPVIDDETAHAALSAGFAVTRYFNAHMAAVHVRYDTTAAIPYVVGPMPTEMLVQISDNAEKIADERAVRLRELFEAWARDAGIPVTDSLRADQRPAANWREIVGSLDFRCGAEGRLHDLAVVPRPSPDDRGSLADVLEGLLFYSGRPVLMMPPGVSDLKADTIAVAWSGSVEATRAVAAADELITAAQRVIVLTVGEDLIDGPSAEDLAQALGTRGVAAEVVRLDRAERSEGRAILDAATRAGADMLVMGAYSHSRLRQLILGGVTRDVIASAELPVFFIH